MSGNRLEIVAAPDPPPTNGKMPRFTIANVSSATVLIADDSPLVLRMIEKMLAGAGLAVLTAADGLEAVEKALTQDVDLVILDVSMPRMNGYQACRLLKSEPLTRGVPEATVREWVGHVDDEMIRRYTHIASQESHGAMQRLEASVMERRAAAKKSS